MEISLNSRVVHFLHCMGKPPLLSGSCFQVGYARLRDLGSGVLSYGQEMLQDIQLLVF